MKSSEREISYGSYVGWTFSGSPCRNAVSISELEGTVAWLSANTQISKIKPEVVARFATARRAKGVGISAINGDLRSRRRNPWLHFRQSLRFRRISATIIRHQRNDTNESQGANA